MKLAALASHVNLPKDAVEKAGASLGISPEQEISSDDIQRVGTFLESQQSFEKSKTDALKAFVLPTQPALREPTSGGALATPAPTVTTPDSAEPSVGRLDMSAFGGLGLGIVSRRNRSDILLERKTRNCGDTAGMVLEGLGTLSKVSTQRDVAKDAVLKALSEPATEHEVWDITVHQHTFTLERFPDGANMLIQSYQPGYSVQHWCGLDDPFIDNPNLQDLPDTWFQPTDALVAQLGDTIGRLYTASREERGAVWEELPFNPDDKLVDSERMDGLAFDANRITFDADEAPGATLRGLQKSIDDLS